MFDDLKLKVKNKINRSIGLTTEGSENSERDRDKHEFELKSGEFVANRELRLILIRFAYLLLKIELLLASGELIFGVIWSIIIANNYLLESFG